MTLIKSISGIRGTIGGHEGDSLSSLDVVKFTYAYAHFITTQSSSSKTIIIGRDARMSGEMISKLVSGTLMSCGLNVIDVGLSTTPTIEVAVQSSGSAGGIIITASHNPENWNALKLLNSLGEFLSESDGKEILEIAESGSFIFNNVKNLGNYVYDNSFNDHHINMVLDLELVNIDAVRSSGFKIVLDAVNSTGGIIIPRMLDRMGVECIELYCDPNGNFPHDPEPLPENITELSNMVTDTCSDFGIVVDPDVDRLAFVCEDGSIFGEEYTIVAISDFILSKYPGNTVSNLSSSRALADITRIHGGAYSYSSVGEVNVVEKMKSTNAIIGGEGNGGVIYPDLHYGRDALVGIALFLTYLAERKISVSNLRSTYPNYFISKNKIKMKPDTNIDIIFSKLEKKYQNENITMIDGLKIDFDDSWIHLRKSNTEPVIRIYAESMSQSESDSLAANMIDEIKDIIE